LHRIETELVDIITALDIMVVDTPPVDMVLVDMVLEDMETMAALPLLVILTLPLRLLLEATLLPRLLQATTTTLPKLLPLTLMSTELPRPHLCPATSQLHLKDQSLYHCLLM
jgi:hypothetical protein